MLDAVFAADRVEEHLHWRVVEPAGEHLAVVGPQYGRERRSSNTTASTDAGIFGRDTGQLIRKLALDPTREYQPRGVRSGNSPETRPNGLDPVWWTQGQAACAV
jgi:hypothetical protein